MASRRLASLLLVAAVSALTAATAYGTRADVRGFGQVRVQGVEGMRYTLRTAYAVPSSWRPIGRRTGLRRRFGPIGSCRIRVTITARAVADVAEDAVARVTRLLPGVGPLYDYGTRVNAAYRVDRAPGGKEVDALLVKPAPTVRQQPAPRIVWIELRARAVIDPRTECHSGGPRTVGEQLGDAFAAAKVGGFQLPVGTQVAGLQ
jgi:hypothetical protein